MRYQIEKGFFDESAILSAMFFCVFINCMDASMTNDVNSVFFDQPCAKVSILPRLDLQCMGRFARVCSQMQMYSFDKIYDTISLDSVCFSDFADSYDRCTKGLRYFVKKKNMEVFAFLWNYHARQRKEELCGMYPDLSEEFSLDRYMVIYYHEFKTIQKTIERDKEKTVKTIQGLSEADRHSLKFSLRCGCANAMQRLQDENIDIAALFPRKNDLELLHCLCRNANPPCAHGKVFVSLAIKYINKYPAEAVDYLLQYRKFEAMMHLIENNIVDVNAQSQSGKTILHYLNYKCGCRAGYWDKYRRCVDPVDLVDELIDQGADVNVEDDKRMTPLHYACKNAHAKTVARLLKCKNIEIGKKNKSGKKPIDYVDHFPNSFASIKKDKKTIKLLLRSALPTTK